MKNITQPNYSLRDRIHYLINQIGGISVYSQTFSILCKDCPDEIDISTREELSKTLGNIEDSYEKAVASLNSISSVLDKTIASKDWIAIKGSIEDDINNIYKSIIIVKEMSGKISDSNINSDILNIAERMITFHDKIEPMCRLIDDFKDILLSKGIYDNAYSDKGELMTKLLVCDYEPEVNSSLKEWFESRGYAVFATNDGEDAIRIVKDKRPQIVYLDIELYAVSGLGVLKSIRQINPDIKVIMVTVWGVEEIREKLQEEGLSADSYMTKPVLVTDLENKVAALALA